MLTTNARLYTNVGKAQISETDSHFKISGIPITKNDSVMNSIAYFANDNEQGMPTMVDQPVTLRHPSVNGVNVSAKQGKGLNYFSGSIVESAPYLDGEHWKVDLQINKKKLAAQDDGERWTEILSNQETFGVSTGLTFTRNSEAGEIDGKEYKMVAKNQSFDHLALLDPKVEAPAGGEDTMVYFNSSVDVGEVIVCNVDEETKEPEISESFINRVANLLKPLFVNEKESGYNKPDLNTNNGDSLMNREEMLKALGLAVNSQITDEELKTLVGNKLAANNDSEKPQDLQKLVTEAVNAAVKPLQDQITANAEQELNGLAEQVAALNMGLDAEAAKKLGVDGCKNFLTANSATSVAGYPLTGGRQTVSTNSAESFADVDLNAGLEG